MDRDGPHPQNIAVRPLYRRDRDVDRDAFSPAESMMRAGRSVTMEIRTVKARIGGKEAAARATVRTELRELHRVHRPPTDQRPRCGARTRSGAPCLAPAWWPSGLAAPRNGRCRMHGGLSTGPRTAAGKARCAGNLPHQEHE